MTESGYFKISIFTNNNGFRLSKRISVNSENKVLKTQNAELAEGWVEQKSFADVEGVAQFITDLPPNKAVSFGICRYESVKVLSRAKASAYNGEENFVTRTSDCFSWPDGPGVLFLDYDPAPNTEAMETEELVEVLRDVVPELKQATMAVKPSVSSCIFKDSEELAGVGGQHIFALCDNARNIPQIGKLIFNRLWLAGHGYIRVSGNGSMLERTIVDAAVWQPERLVFGRAACAEGLEQRFPTPLIFPPE